MHKSNLSDSTSEVLLVEHTGKQDLFAIIHHFSQSLRIFLRLPPKQVHEVIMSTFIPRKHRNVAGLRGKVNGN